jgi:PAS domain S-box-containing protein
MLGALMIMAATALRAARAERQVETLQLKLLDERSYHAFVDGAVEGFFRTTHDGRYLIANPALARMYGYETAEQLQAELTDISASLYIDPNRRNEFHALMKSTRIVRDFVSQIRRRDGQLIWISENARTVTDEDDQFLLYEGTVEDITEKRLSEEATQRALRETQEAARQKGAFLAAMSHELKTPLNAVIGFSDLMRQELFGPIENERYRSYVGDVHENGLRLLAMINSILDFSRIEGGLLDLEESVIAVSEAVTAAREEMISRGKPMPTIALHVPPDLPALRADPKRLHQILMQLLSNAAKFTSRNGRIDIIAKVLAGGGVAVMVRDTGIYGLVAHPRRAGAVQTARCGAGAPLRGPGPRVALGERLDAAARRKPVDPQRARSWHDRRSRLSGRARGPRFGGPGGIGSRPHSRCAKPRA